MEKKKQNVMYGLLSGLGLVVVSLIIYVMGLTFKPGVSYIAYIPFLIGIILNAIAFSKSRDGFVTFGNVFGNCFQACIIVTLIVLAWSVLSMNIFPEMKDKAFEIATQGMKNKGLPDDQVETSLAIMHKFYTPMLIGSAIIGTLFFGVIFSLVGAIVAKKKGPVPITSDNF